MDQLYGTLSGDEQLDGVLTIPKTIGSNLGTKTITENDTYYAEDDGLDGYSEVTVNVSGGSTPTLETVTKTYTPTTSQQTETITPSSGYDGIGEVDVTVNAIPSQYIIPTGTKSISSNGTGIDVKEYEYADVAVPNSYSAADEGKVVSSGALVAQTAHADVTPTTSDQTIDTTTNNSIKVKGDVDLVAANIKKDVELFGIIGSYEGGGGGDFFDMSEPSGSVSSNVTSIPQYVVNGRIGVTSISLPNLITIPGNAFSGCTSVQKIDVGNASIGGSFQNAFNGCSSLQGFVLKEQAESKSRTLYNNCFNGCSNLEYIDMCVAGTSQNDVFKNCAKLDVIVFRKTSVTTLGNVAHFNGTPFASGGTGGTLYVPNNLISSYQSASNWSTILGYANNQIKSIESTHTDPTAPIDLTLYYADGTPLPT